jgi:hypothetical protein
MSGAGSGGITAKKPYTGCTDCCSPATKYLSAEGALQHLHTVHFECPLGESATGRTNNRPHDDPCYAYIKSLADTHSNEPDIEKIAKEFIDHLSDFSGSLSQIQWLVATNSPDNAQRRRPGPNLHQRPNEAAPQPQLPRSLVYAFDELVAYYVLQAKRLSLQNREVGLNMRNPVRESWQAQKRIETQSFRCHGRVLHYLQQARRDVILSWGGGDTDTALGVQTFDTTSFVRALTLSALHTSFLVPLAQKAATAARVGSKWAPANPQHPAWDVVGIYSEYSKQLHLQAARRPRRRLFLEIHALEDELEALKGLLNRNMECIRW